MEIDAEFWLEDGRGKKEGGKKEEVDEDAPAAGRIREGNGKRMAEAGKEAETEAALATDEEEDDDEEGDNKKRDEAERAVAEEC